MVLELEEKGDRNFIFVKKQGRKRAMRRNEGPVAHKSGPGCRPRRDGAGGERKMRLRERCESAGRNLPGKDVRRRE